MKTLRCPDCGQQLVTWEEATLLVAPPDWWPTNTPFAPDPQTTSHELCLACGRHTEEHRTT